MKRFLGIMSLAILTLAVVGAGSAQGAPVGNFLQVEGQVDLLKGGKLPAATVKVQDGVEVGDVVRTKSQSRAQIKFVDDTVITLAPESRVTIEDYMFDGAKGERRAVLGVLRGVVETTVEKVYRKDEPDFIMKTHTAVMGVRGTKWYTKILPNATDIYTAASKLEVKNLLPEYPGVAQMLTLQYVRVSAFMNPTIPVNITLEDLKAVQQTLKFGAGVTSKGDPAPGAAPSFITPAIFAAMSSMRTTVENISTGLYVPPQPQPRPQIDLLPFYIQIVWGPGANDLDLWLSGPLANGTLQPLNNNNRFQVYYGNRGSLTEVPYALYHLDCTTSGGSEVIRVERFIQGGTYKVTVHNYTERNNPDSMTLSDTAGVTLELIKGGTVVNRQSSGGGMGSIVEGGRSILNLTPPTGQKGIAWEALEINPANGQVTKVNRISRTFNP